MVKAQLSSKLTVSISLALLPGVLLAIAYVSVQLSRAPTNWTDTTRDQMILAEILNLDRLAVEKAAFTGTLSLCDPLPVDISAAPAPVQTPS